MLNHVWHKQRIVVALLSFLFLSACGDDPSQIGIGLVDPQAGEIEVLSLGASSSEFTGAGDLTGGTTTAGAVRSLFGTVQDPVAGSFSMTGYMDFIASANVSSAFRAATVRYAELELNVDYLYGDTKSNITLEIYDIDDAWDSAERKADSFLPAQSLVTTVTVTPKQGKMRIPLPSTWITKRDAVLRSTNFVDTFHGFAIRASQGNTILGSHFSASSLRASSVPGDTVNFSMSKVFSASSFRNANANPLYTSLRDGAAETLSLRFPTESEDLGEAAIHRVIIRLNADNVSSLYPADFNRPGMTRVGLRAVAVDNQTRLNLQTVQVPESGVVTFDSDVLANVIQSSNLGNSGLDRFELYFPVESSTVDFLAFKKGTPATFGPRAVITYTSLN